MRDSSPEKPVATFENHFPSFGTDEYLLYADHVEVRLRAGRTSMKTEVYELMNLSGGYTFHRVWAAWPVLLLGAPCCVLCMLFTWQAYGNWLTSGKLDVVACSLASCVFLVLFWMLLRTFRRAIYTCCFDGHPPLDLTVPQENRERLMVFAKVLARQILLVHSNRASQHV